MKANQPIRAGLRSLIVPGWGQLATRHRRIGWALVITSLAAAVGTLILAAMLGPVELAARLARPASLMILLAVNLVVALTRLASAEHAWWAGGGRNLLVAVVLAGLVLTPHVAVAWVGTETRNTLLDVFAPPEPPPWPTAASPPDTSSTTTTPTTTSTTTTTTTTTTTFPVPLPDFPPPAPDFVPPTTPTTLPPFANARLNLLLLGGDAGPGRSGLRTDTMIVASVDTATGEAALFGLPRNFGGFTFSDGTPFPGEILNEVYGWGRRHPEAFGGADPGASALVDVAEHITGLDIDHFMLVDLTGFADLVNAFGGVTLDVPVPIDGPLYNTETGGYTMIRIRDGRQRLDGAEALAYTRARHGSTDYARMRRQRCVLAAMIDDADTLSLLANLPGLLEVISTHVTTDIPLELVPHLIRLAAQVSAEEIRVVGFDHRWRAGRTGSGYPIPDIDSIRSAVMAALFEPAADVDVAMVADACS